MEDNNQKQKKKKLIPKAPQKPNYQIWVILILFFLIIAVSYFNRNGGAKIINQSQFTEMYKSHDIEKLVLVKGNDPYVEIYLKEEALKNRKYQELLPPQSTFNLSQGPQFQLDIVSVDRFDEQ